MTGKRSNRLSETLAKACIHDWLACAFVRLRRPKAPLREPFLPRLLGDAQSALPILVLACVLRGQRPARPPCPPSMPHYHAAGVVAPCSLTLAPPAGKDSFNTILEHSLLNLLGEWSGGDSPIHYLRANRTVRILLNTNRSVCSLQPLSSAFYRRESG